MSMSQTAYRTRRSLGFTIVEVLVSLVVLSIGLLGMAKLVLVSAHANDSAYMRSQATALGYEILDKMRANTAGALAHGYDTTLGSMPSAPTTCVGTGVYCTPTQTAAWDIYSWKQHLTAAVTYGALPSGTASIVTSATSPVSATIIVQWDDSVAQAAFGAVPTTSTVAPMTVTLETVLQ